ncbi:MAG: isoaspartyl peptidase/L-asparaginase [Candidatus Thermoplasmatota archaeon]|nr:isoaspartyl peptidase/L-asparaginase [Candidatus Thermoplasmatota archaeon]MCL5731554.1 isoaspartyl peptidase/L-asparaginase [Candidatus Thermoplasmatota archaeon]
MENILILHGGAGGSLEVQNKNSEALRKIGKDASKMNTVEEIVIEAVRLMENDTRFNAGTGSVIRVDGSVQMDAAVMSGNRFASVISIENVKNPILVARDVLNKSPHSILSGDGAIRFARKLGHDPYDPRTERTMEVYRKMKEALDKNSQDETARYSTFRKYADLYSDTVGAIARKDGNFAAAISTGGVLPMLRGRVGDCPLPGCGIYAGDKGAVAVSGNGEEIIRRMLSLSVYLEIGKKPLQEILDTHISNFNSPTGIIAVSESEYSIVTNAYMATAVVDLL